MDDSLIFGVVAQPVLLLSVLPQAHASGRLENRPLVYRQVRRRPGDTAIVSGTIALDLEGVESEVQLERLRELGCDLAQEFHFFEAITEGESADLPAEDGRRQLGV